VTSGVDLVGREKKVTVQRYLQMEVEIHLRLLFLTFLTTLSLEEL